MSQRDLARRLGNPYSQDVLSRIETQARRLDPCELVDLCQALEVDPCEILKQIASYQKPKKR